MLKKLRSITVSATLCLTWACSHPIAKPPAQAHDQHGFSGALIQNSRLDGAKAYGLDFSGASIVNTSAVAVDLSFANLSHARLLNVDLREAILVGANLDGTQYDGKTRLPFLQEEARARGMTLVVSQTSRQITIKKPFKPRPARVHDCLVSATLYQDHRTSHLNEFSGSESDLELAQRICASETQAGHPAPMLDVSEGASVFHDFCRVPQKIACQKAPLASRDTPPRFPTQRFSWNNPGSYSPSPPAFNYRGDEKRMGVQNVPEIPKGKLKLAWRAQPLNIGVHTASKSSPAVDETGVYVGSDDGWFYKFDLDGNKIWSFYASCAERGIHATAALDKDRVYVGAYNGYLYALSKKDGKPAWQVKLGDYIGSSALLDDGYLYSSVEYGSRNGYVVKVRASDGEVVWVSGFLGQQAHSSPTLSRLQNVLMTGSNAGKISAFDPDTGKLLWEFGTGGEIKGTGALLGDQYIFGSWDGNAYSINPHLGRQFWKAWLGGQLMSSACVSADHGIALFSTDYEIAAISVATGEVIWRHPFFRAISHRKVSWGKQSGTILQDSSGHSLAVIQCGVKKLCGMNVEDGHLQWQFPLPENYSGSATFFKGSLYLALDNSAGLIRLDFATSTPF